MNARIIIGRTISIAFFAAGIAALAYGFLVWRARPENVLRAKQTIEVREIQPNQLIDLMTEVYGAPISFEYPHHPGGKPDVVPRLRFGVEEGTVLRAAFEMIEIESYGMFKGTSYSGKPCIVPAWRFWKEDRSNMDRPVNFSFVKMTVFDALNAIVSAVNQYHVPGFELKLNPGGIYVDTVPPDAFLTDPIVTVSGKGLPAREAVCRILAASPLEMSWTYGHISDYEQIGGEAYLAIRFFEDSKPMALEAMTPQDKVRWDAYKQSGVLPPR